MSWGDLGRARTRSELFSTRKNLAIKHNQECFESEPTVQDFRRLDLITIPKAWTRCSNTSKSFLKDLYEHNGDGGGSGKAETKMSQDEVKVDL